MPRALPWLKNGASSSPATSHVAKRPRPLPRPRATSSSDDDEDLSYNTTGVSKSARGRGINGTPSSSPPPPAPQQEDMLEGYADDDRWMMVEDEFLDTAKLFTRHLHRAEYDRLKRFVEENRHARREQDSKPRPMAGFTTHNRVTRRGYVRNRSISPSDALDDMRGTGLGMLMDGPQGHTRLLSRALDRNGSQGRDSLHRTPLSSAEVGRAISSSETDEDEVDEKPPSMRVVAKKSTATLTHEPSIVKHKRIASATSAPRSAIKSECRGPVQEQQAFRRVSIVTESTGTTSRMKTPASRPKVKMEMLDRDSTSEDESSKKLQAIFAKRRAAKARVKEVEKIEIEIDAIPSFKFA